MSRREITPGLIWIKMKGNSIIGKLQFWSSVVTVLLTTLYGIFFKWTSRNMWDDYSHKSSTAVFAYRNIQKTPSYWSNLVWKNRSDFAETASSCLNLNVPQSKEY